jgi:hypothetical protein
VGEQPDCEQLRTAFESVAERYDAARPIYPEALLDDLVSRRGCCAAAARSLIVETTHALPADADPFWADVQADFGAIVPHPDNRPPPAPEDVGDLREEIEASGLFRDVEARRDLWDVEYGPDEYLALLGTYSVNLALPAAQRDELFARIHARIAERGCVRKTYSRR